MEKKETKSEKKEVKKPSGSFVAIKGIALADGRRFEEGDKVSDLTPDEVAALKEMQAIEGA